MKSAVDNPMSGYEVHHIVEKKSASRAGFAKEQIESRDNLVLIPTMKHREITGWFMRPNDDFGGLSPRAYLKGKSWEERRKLGLRALIDRKVLKP